MPCQSCCGLNSPSNSVYESSLRKFVQKQRKHARYAIVFVLISPKPSKQQDASLQQVAETIIVGRLRRAVAAMASNPKKVLVPVADGCEEMEAVITIDVLVRAGADVTVASVDSQTVRCSRGVKLQADVLIADAAKETFDLIAVPVC